MNILMKPSPQWRGWTSIISTDSFYPLVIPWPPLFTRGKIEFSGRLSGLSLSRLPINLAGKNLILGNTVLSYLCLYQKYLSKWVSGMQVVTVILVVLFSLVYKRGNKGLEVMEIIWTILFWTSNPGPHKSLKLLMKYLLNEWLKRQEKLCEPHNPIQL